MANGRADKGEHCVCVSMGHVLVSLQCQLGWSMGFLEGSLGCEGSKHTTGEFTAEWASRR